MPIKIPETDVPELATDRLVLRPTCKKDARALHQLRSNEDTMKFIQRPRTKSEQDALDLMQFFEKGQLNGEAITWAMAFKQSPSEMIGIIGLYRINAQNLRGEVGYTLAPEFWGRGLMSEALKRLLGYSFEELEFHSLEAHTAPRNQNSKKLLERNGFVHVGSFRDCLFFEGEFYSSDVYELLKSNHLAPPD